jgi:hypothetical protein
LAEQKDDTNIGKLEKQL